MVIINFSAACTCTCININLHIDTDKKLISLQVVNFMSTDTDRIVNFGISFHMFWSLPFQIIVALVLLYLQVSSLAKTKHNCSIALSLFNVFAACFDNTELLSLSLPPSLSLSSGVARAIDLVGPQLRMCKV